MPLQRSVLFERFARIYPRLCTLPRRYRRRLQRSLSTSLAGAALLLALGHAPTALTAQIRVNTLIPDINPDGRCSLVEAIINANDDVATHPDCRVGSGEDTIRLRRRTYTLTSPYAGENGLPVVTSEISIDGNGATIEWPEGTPPFTVFEVANSGDLTIDDTTIVGNYLYSQVSYGAGILNRGGALKLENSAVSLMSNGVSIRGGENATPTTIVTNSTLSGNYYDGISSSGGEGILTLDKSMVIGNDGDGISVRGTELTINNSTISGNEDEGVTMEDAISTISNSTITGNEFLGIAAYLNSSLTVVNSTVSGNYYYGIQIGNSTAVLNRTLVSGNFYIENSFAKEVSVYGESSVISNFNLFGHDGVSNAQAFKNFIPGTTDITATSDGTQPTALNNILDTILRDNGGTTQTHSLVSGGPAIDAAGPGCPPPNTDQRGMARPQGTACDIGAFELEQPVGSGRPNLVIEKIDHPDTITVGEPLTYTLTVRNEGTVAASKVRVVDTLPDSVELVSIPGNCSARRNRVNCTLGDLDSGVEHSLEIVVVPGKAGKLVNRAKARLKEKDADPSSNSVKQPTTVIRP